MAIGISLAEVSLSGVIPRDNIDLQRNLLPNSPFLLSPTGIVAVVQAELIPRVIFPAKGGKCCKVDELEEKWNKGKQV